MFKFLKIYEKELIRVFLQSFFTVFFLMFLIISIMKYAEIEKSLSIFYFINDTLESLIFTLKMFDVIILIASVIFVAKLKINLDIYIINFFGLYVFRIFRIIIVLIIFINSLNIFFIQPVIFIAKNKIFERFQKLNNLSYKIRIINKKSNSNEDLILLNKFFDKKLNRIKYNDLIIIKKENNSHSIIYGEKLELIKNFWRIENAILINPDLKSSVHIRDCHFRTNLKEKDIKDSETDERKINPEHFNLYEMLNIIINNIKKDIKLFYFEKVKIQTYYQFVLILFSIFNFLVVLYFNLEKNRNVNWIRNYMKIIFSFITMKNIIWIFESIAKKKQMSFLILIPPILGLLIMIILIEIKEWQNKLSMKTNE